MMMQKVSPFTASNTSRPERKVGLSNRVQEATDSEKKLTLAPTAEKLTL